MNPRSSSAKKPAEQVMKDIRRATRRHFSAEDKIRIVLDGLRGEDSIAEICRKEGIAQSLYYTWSKEFMEAGKRHLAGDTARAATTDEVKDLRLRRALQPPALSREPRQRDTSRRLLWQGRSHHQTARKDQTPDYPTSALAAPQDRRLTSTLGRDRLSANPRPMLSQMF